ncbi:MAG: DUF4920 domain-containing protein [Bacteroidota bacterium]
MKRRPALLLLPLLLMACQSAPEQAPAVEAPMAEVAFDTYGTADVSAAESTPVRTIVGALEQYAGQPVTIEGKIYQVCQMKGCWFTMDGGDGQFVRINVPRDESGNYVYTFDKGISGRTAYVRGTLEAEEISVDELRHYAQDNGRSEAEIAAITEPRQELRLTAEGALVTKATS